MQIRLSPMGEGLSAPSVFCTHFWVRTDPLHSGFSVSLITSVLSRKDTKMTADTKQYFIYIRSTKEKIPVSKQEFDDYYRDINAYRRTQMNHGRCVCPRSKWLHCDMDCLTCPFHRCGNQLSLDTSINEDDFDDEVRAWEEDFFGSTVPVDEAFANDCEMQQLLVRLTELMPEAISVGNLRLDGWKETEISEHLGINRVTIFSRLKKAKEILSEEFPNYF